MTSPPKPAATAKVKPYWVAIGLALPVLLILAHAALISPEVEFLPPSRFADWIVHPENQSRGFYAAEYESPDLYFYRSFELEQPPRSFPVRITAFREFAVEVNGAPWVPADSAESLSWKRGREVELAPLLSSGVNRLVVRVSNSTGPPALLVEGLDDVSGTVASDSRWRVSRGRRPAAAASAAVAGRGEKFLDAQPSSLEPSGAASVVNAIRVALVALLVYALIPARYKPWLSSTRADPSTPEFGEGQGLPLLIFLLVAVLQLRNAVLFVSVGSMDDAIAHLDYVFYVLESWSPPTPDQGWQMYQPPLYYFAAAAVAALARQVSSSEAIETSLQVFGAALGLLSVGMAWLLAHRLFPGDSRARNLGFSVAAFLPLGFYMYPQITNEVFAGSLIGSTLFLSCVGLFGRKLDWKWASVLGLACGLCLLAKYTGLFLALSIATLLGLRVLTAQGVAQQRKRVGPLVVFVLVAVLVSGWLYVRNARDYGDAFVGNWDRASGYGYEQEPGYRTARFYTHLDVTFSQRPERAKWSSFWDGLHGSLWADSHRFFPDEGRAGRSRAESVVLWLALLPAVGILVGFARACRTLLRKGWDHPFFLLVTTSFWTLGAVVLFTLELPFYSTVSAVFLLSLVPAIGVFAGLGLEWMCRQVGGLRYLIYGQLVLLYGLIAYTFTLPAA